ncbi:MAG: zinc ABC transporter ATP-binding protein, partial [Bacteroidales bacterium 45-6]
MKKVLEIANLCVGYEKNSYVLKRVNLSVFEHDFLGIIGPNGGGKTTLLKSIMGLISPSEGEITFYKDGSPCSSINIGYMPQINQIDKKFPISVREVITSGLTQPKGLFNKYSTDQKRKVESVALQMGLQDLLKKPIGALSGGQLQRALLGRSIVDDPDLLILDEPNSYVDKKFESDFYKILTEVNKTTTIILVSHDIGTVVSLVKNIACVNEGLHYHEGANVSPEWLEKSYSYPIEIVGHDRAGGADDPHPRVAHVLPSEHLRV